MKLSVLMIVACWKFFYLSKVRVKFVIFFIFLYTFQPVEYSLVKPFVTIIDTEIHVKKNLLRLFSIIKKQEDILIVCLVWRFVVVKKWIYFIWSRIWRRYYAVLAFQPSHNNFPTRLNFIITITDFTVFLITPFRRIINQPSTATGIVFAHISTFFSINIISFYVHTPHITTPNRPFLTYIFIWIWGFWAYLFRPFFDHRLDFNLNDHFVLEFHFGL